MPPLLMYVIMLSVFKAVSGLPIPKHPTKFSGERDE